MDILWPDSHVCEDALKHSVVEIRKALGDDAKAPRFIETVHRRGYRFIAKIGVRRETNRSQRKTDKRQELRPATRDLQLVGRDSELAQLQHWLEMSLGGARQIAFVTGEQGIGKTALVDTFLSLVDRGPYIESPLSDSDPGSYKSGVCVGRGQCLKLHGRSEAYMPVLEAFTRLCQGPAGKQVIAVLYRHAPLWLTQMPSVVSTAKLEMLKSGMIGATRRRMLREMGEVIEALSTHIPLILVLEDLHWSDRSTLDLISYLAQRREPARLLLLATFRFAEVMGDGHPLRGIKQELQLHQQCGELALARLEEAAVAEYLMRRFPGHELPVGLESWIYRQTDGNPLFMVNIVDHLVAQGSIIQREGHWFLNIPLEALAPEVPATIQQMIRLKIERCSHGEQRVLEAGSIEGMEFSTTAVAAALNEESSRIEELCKGMARRYNFLQPESSHQLSDGTLALRYKFTHTLYQDICYKEVPETRRAQFHRSMGEYIEEAYVDYMGNMAAKLATHFEQGREYGRAIKYFQQAADNANRRFADREAIELARRGLRLLDMTPKTPKYAYHELKLQIALGMALMTAQGFGSEEVKRTFTRALELSQEVGESVLLFSALFGLWRCCRIRGEYRKAHELANQLLQLGQREQNPTVQGHANHAMGATLMDLGKFNLALECLGQDVVSRGIQEQDSHAFLFRNDPLLTCLCYRALAKWMLGYPDQSLTDINKALALAREPRQSHDFVLARYFAAVTHHLRRDSKQALEWADEAMAHARQQGLVQWIALISGVRGWALSKEGESNEGIEQMYQALAAHQDIGSAESHSPILLTMLVETLLDAGRIAEGLATVEKALVGVHKVGNRHYEAEMHRIKGELLLRESRIKLQAPDRNKPQSLHPDIGWGQAEACFNKAIEVALEQKAKSFELRATTSLARLWQKQNRTAEAKQKLEEIYSWFNEGYDTADLKEAGALLHQLL